MTEHTPGPWEADTEKPGRVVAAGAAFVADTIPPGCEHDAEDQANARLIAAAPELLDALENLAGFASHYATVTAIHAGGDRLIENARAAILKAREGW